MKLSVNLNKIALLRNSRGNDSPSLEDYANLAIKLGVDGLTLHPRPDHRHATSNDAKEISKICKDNNLEFNLEGNPFSLPENDFLGFKELCNITFPNQITLVPDTLDQVTSDHGWQPGHLDDELIKFLEEVKKLNSRTSLFIDSDPKSVDYAAKLGFDRVEIYTGPFAHLLKENKLDLFKQTQKNIIECIAKARDLGLGVNAGHDLNLENLPHLKQCGIIDEVSIGHAIMTDALKFGFSDTIMKYIKIIRNN
tara:strand:- start:593 stop:1348 length:756 start_codon:yes stop_codon:yes gene_type:complete